LKTNEKKDMSPKLHEIKGKQNKHMTAKQMLESGNYSNIPDVLLSGSPDVVGRASQQAHTGCATPAHLGGNNDSQINRRGGGDEQIPHLATFH
jgi:hypothetical protein